jgi:cyclopropane fatty-acyl-phospholipid synthase-like methyltransferase
VVTILDQTNNTPEAWSARADVAATPHEACGWSERGQCDRLRAVVAALDPQPGDSLLDWGSGTGEFCRYLPADVGYVGFDFAEGMVIRAAREHPDHHFQAWEPMHAFDLVAAVGPFNLPENWSKQMTFATLRRLWDRTGRTLCVSLYAGQDERCLIYTEEECERFGSGESYRWNLDRWRPNDLILTLDRGPRKRVF